MVRYPSSKGNSSLPVLAVHPAGSCDLRQSMSGTVGSPPALPAARRRHHIAYYPGKTPTRQVSIGAPEALGALEAPSAESRHWTCLAGSAWCLAMAMALSRGWGSSGCSSFHLNLGSPLKPRKYAAAPRYLPCSLGTASPSIRVRFDEGTIPSLLILGCQRCSWIRAIPRDKHLLYMYASLVSFALPLIPWPIRPRVGKPPSFRLVDACYSVRCAAIDDIILMFTSPSIGAELCGRGSKAALGRWKASQPLGPFSSDVHCTVRTIMLA